MKRRGFLGLMGGALAAGPSMAKEAVTQTMADLSVPGVGIPYGMGGMPPGAQNAADPYNEREHLQGQLRKLLGKSAAEKLREKKTMGVNMLDPDLAAMRSFSLSARMRIQQDRNYERMLEQERGWIERRLADLLS